MSSAVPPTATDVVPLTEVYEDLNVRELLLGPRRFSELKADLPGISAFPMAARVVQKVAHEDDFDNFLLMHAMGANAAGQVASVVAGVWVAADRLRASSRMKPSRMKPRSL